MYPQLDYAAPLLLALAAGTVLADPDHAPHYLTPYAQPPPAAVYQVRWGQRKRKIREKENKTPLPAPEQVLVYLVLHMGGGDFHYCPSPSYSLISCTCSSSDYFGTDEQLLPHNWINDEENSCYPNSLLPVTYQSVLFSAWATCLAIWVLFQSNPQGGCGSQIFSFIYDICASPLWQWLARIVDCFTDYPGIPALKMLQIFLFVLIILTFVSDIQRVQYLVDELFNLLINVFA